MIQTHRTYKVKESDTLADIAKYHSIDVQELIAYHNERAEFHQKIRNRIPDFLQEIILPPEGYTVKNGKEVWRKENGHEPNVLAEPFTGKLSCKPSQKDLCYGVLKTIKNGEKESTIKYETSVRIYPKDNDNERFVSVDITSKTYINDEEPGLVADELALACTEVLYPIIFIVDKNARILEIQNHDEILNRWKKQKATKLKYYEGDVALNYFESFEQTLIDKELSLYYLKNDWFLHLYFNTLLYSTYLPENKEKAVAITFPIIPNTAPVAFKVKKKAKIFKKNNRIRIDVKGTCSDKRSKDELERKLFFPSVVLEESSIIGKYRTVCFLKPNNNRIQSAFLECELELTKPKYASISISAIDETSESETRHPEFIKKQYESKPSFWKSLFS